MFGRSRSKPFDNGSSAKRGDAGVMPMAKDEGRRTKDPRSLIVADPEPILGEVDADQLSEAVANLIDNTINFTPSCRHIKIAVAAGPNF
jgi:signal transduction histidine kinase